MIHNGKPELECVFIRIPAVAKLYGVFLKKLIISLWLNGTFIDISFVGTTKIHYVRPGK
jgi:hypothetical protein